MKDFLLVTYWVALNFAATGMFIFVIGYPFFKTQESHS